MPKPVIEVNNLAKQYRLGAVGSSTMSDDLKRFFYRLRGKEDPFLKIGETNDRSKKGNSEYVWALKDINFKVNQGEVLGIIGKNGAGKSTLLKILSRTTLPTIGEYKIKGRIASLLEVGTGFHPDLSGRENIYLNGAILGMRKSEIKKQFDEIVDFSGVERYIDTPVKRYSSGMYVRLAFAVAAHLEPEILIIDEVLAVGDAEFQKKCLGKMKDVSGQGRTVLFVSHNMAAVKSLCGQGLLLENGQVKMTGNIEKVVSHYFGGDNNVNNYKEFAANALRHHDFIIRSFGVKAQNKDYRQPILRNDVVEFELKYLNNNNPDIRYDVTLKFKGGDGEYVMVTSTGDYNTLIKQGEHTLQMLIPGKFFNEGTFYLDLLLIENKHEAPIMETDIISFSINPENRPVGAWMGKEVGYLQPSFEWK